MTKHPERQEAGSLALLFVLVVIATLAGSPRELASRHGAIETSVCGVQTAGESAAQERSERVAAAPSRRFRVFGALSSPRGLCAIEHGRPLARAPTEG